MRNNSAYSIVKLRQRAERPAESGDATTGANQQIKGPATRSILMRPRVPCFSLGGSPRLHVDCRGGPSCGFLPAPGVPCFDSFPRRRKTLPVRVNAFVGAAQEVGS
jgi:hypothetical protein